MTENPWPAEAITALTEAFYREVNGGELEHTAEGQAIIVLDALAKAGFDVRGIKRRRIDAADFEIRRYDPALFSPGSAGAGGYCSAHGRSICGPPVFAVYGTKVRGRSGLEGFWRALCQRHAEIEAARQGVELP